MHVQVESQVDNLSYQMAMILITNPFAAPVCLLGLIQSQMYTELMDGLDKMATKEISDFEHTLYELFQIPGEAYTASDRHGYKLMNVP